MANNIDWYDLIINHWKTNNIQLETRTSLEIISKAECVLEFKFPESFKSLYIKVNGFKDFDWTVNMISIWPIERILEEHSRYENFIGFADYLINSHVYGFQRNQKGIFKNYDLHIRKLFLGRVTSFFGAKIAGS